MSDQREMTLDEYLESKLPDFHLARRQLQELREERDALAAHCAQLLSAGWRLKHELQQWSLTERDPQTSTVLAYWDAATDEKPSASLASLKAEWQAEAFWQFITEIEKAGWETAPALVVNALYTRCAELRRQAEENSDE